ncbi:MAG: hypothetical protein IH868_07680 [Chloroflexi bacterium]|nr:hypothetical protein [Chloroflexota bacterium]
MQTEIQASNSARDAETRPAIYERLDQAGAVGLLALGYLRQPLGILGVFAAALAIVGIFYLLAARERDAIEARIDESRAILALTAPDLEQLQLRLDGWDYSRALALDGRIGQPAESDVLEDLMAAATLAGVDVFSAGAREEGIETVAGGEYRSTPTFIKATGDLDEITTFIKLLESGAIRSARVQKSLVSESQGEYSIEVDITSLSEFPYAMEDAPPADDAPVRQAAAAVTP